MSLLRKYRCCKSDHSSLYKLLKYSATWRLIGSEIFTSLLEILAVWENARAQHASIRDGGIRLFLVRTEDESGGGDERFEHAEAIFTVNLHERFLSVTATLFVRSFVVQRFFLAE